RQFIILNIAFQRWYLTTSKDQLLDEPYAVMMMINEEIKDPLLLEVNSFQRWYLTTSKDQLLDEPYADMMWIDFGIKDPPPTAKLPPLTQ
ncbi:MAG: hypothetical protein EZS28_054946, partial [Streblomastix strix]